MSRAVRRRWLCLLAVLFLVASVALSARLLVAGSVVETPGASHDGFTSAPEKAQPAASDGRSTDRPQDRPSPEGQQPAGLEESKDGSAKKFLSAFAVLFAPFEVWYEYAGWKPGPVAVEGGSDDSPPQLLQRPPPTG
jgi:hypothetical protein